MMKYTPPTRIDRNPMASAPTAAARAGAPSAARRPGHFGRRRAAVYAPIPKNAEWPNDTMPA